MHLEPPFVLHRKVKQASSQHGIRVEGITLTCRILELVARVGFVCTQGCVETASVHNAEVCNV